jgi:O-antigen/teichoic acid export membrane protein
LILAATAALAPHPQFLLHVPSSSAGTEHDVFVLTGIYFAAVLVASVPLAVLRGLQRFDLINAVVAASVLISAAVYVIVLVLGGGVVELVSAVLILELLVQVPFVIVIRRIAPWLHADGLLPTRETMRVLLTYGSMRSLIRLGTVVRSRSDELILGALAPVGAVGPYAICRRFAVAPSMLTSQLVDVILPMSSQLSAAAETQRLRDLTLAGLRLSMGLMLVFGVGIAFLAEPFLRAWVGSPYAQYAAVAPVFVATALLDTVQATVAAVVGGIGRQRAAAKASTIGAAVKVALGIALYKTAGVEGVAFGGLVAAALTIAPPLLDLGRHLHLTFTAAARAVLPATLLPLFPACGVVYALSRIFSPTGLPSVFAIGAVGGIVYLAGYSSFGSTLVERAAVQEALGRVRRRRATS